MITAASGGISFGTIGSYDGSKLSPAAMLGVQGISVVINLVLMLILRFALQRLWHKSPMDSPYRALAFHAICYLLPWMPRVIGSNLMSAISALIESAVSYTDDVDLKANSSSDGSELSSSRGQAFGSLLGCFLTFFWVCCYFNLLTTRGNHSFGPDASTPEYLIQVGFGCFSTMAGKSLTFMFDIIHEAFTPSMVTHGHISQQYWIVITITLVLEFCLAVWLLGCALKRMRRGAKNTFQLAQVDTLAYVVAYWWAFSLVNTMWTIFGYADDANGQNPDLTSLMFGMWWLLLCALLAIVFAVGRYYIGPPYYDFNQPPKVFGLGTFLLMMGWAVNFVAWWAWAQILLWTPSIQINVDDNDKGLYVFLAILYGGIEQLIIFCVLVAVTAMVNYMNVRVIVLAVKNSPDHERSLKSTFKPTEVVLNAATGRAEVAAPDDSPPAGTHPALGRVTLTSRRTVRFDEAPTITEE